MGGAVEAAMETAIELAQSVASPSPNPRVGCVLLDETGTEIGRGVHKGPGRAHAEVAALRDAADRGNQRRLAGSTAVVTMEPCNHHGRTGPCTEALLAAQVAQVVYGQSDPNPVAQGGTQRLSAAGVRVQTGVLDRAAAQLNRRWTDALQAGRPFFLWKVAATLDGKVAAGDGTSRWISGEQAREESHQLRAAVDSVMVGTGTQQQDDPTLTARIDDAEQPWRVVVGRSEVPMTAKVRLADPQDRFWHIPSRDPGVVSQELTGRGIKSVLLEGGPTLAAAFLSENLVDEVRWYSCPTLLGSGRSGVADLDIGTLTDALQFEIAHTHSVGPDLRIDLVPQSAG